MSFFISDSIKDVVNENTLFQNQKSANSADDSFKIIFHDGNDYLKSKITFLEFEQNYVAAKCEMKPAHLELLYFNALQLVAIEFNNKLMYLKNKYRMESAQFVDSKNCYAVKFDCVPSSCKE
tara:strand:+ start:2659 stop:3024 length:366 start_codon:yes stop_codon:yes gene_type:complete